MSIRHYIATTRQLRLIHPADQDIQFIYNHEGSMNADTATHYFSCGKYAIDDWDTGKASFHDPQHEAGDYLPGASEEAYSSHHGSLALFTELFDALEKEKKDLLIFMFGFDNKLLKESGHLGHLHKSYIAEGNANLGRILMLTWPSQGKVGYNAERGYPEGADNYDDTRKSDVITTGRALAVFLLKLKNFMDTRYANTEPGIYRPKMHIIIQSMANCIWDIMARALIRANRLDSLRELFHTLMLTSPDIRNDIFQVSPAYAQATSLAKRAFVVYSKEDNILGLSDFLHHEAATSPLGSLGPANKDFVPANTHMVEVTQPKEWIVVTAVKSLIGKLRKKKRPIDIIHRYFEYNKEVRDLYTDAFTGKPFEREKTIEASTPLPA